MTQTHRQIRGNQNRYGCGTVDPKGSKPNGDNPRIDPDSPEFFSHPHGNPRVNRFDQADQDDARDSKGSRVYSEDVLADHKHRAQDWRGD